MSFEEDWEQHKNAAATRTQLNSADASGTRGGSGDLVVNQDDLGAVGHEAYQLHEDLKKAGDIVSAGSKGKSAGATTHAGNHLHSRSFELGHALTQVVDVWTSQLKTVLQGCAHISNHLDYSNKAHKENDHKIGASMRNKGGAPTTVSQISKLIH